MIVGENFFLDSERIAWIQHDVYATSLPKLFVKARAEYRRAESVVGINGELGVAFNIESFDHRTLQWLHDAVAARFRFMYCIEGDLFDDRPPVGSDENYIISLWYQFLDQELDRLFKKWLELPRNIGVAACFPNPDPRGNAAEDWLYEMTLLEYPDCFNKPWFVSQEKHFK